MRSVLAGPYTWTIAAGTAGWRAYTLPAAVDIAANTVYVVSISNSTDQYYAEQIHGFDAPIVNGHLHADKASGVAGGLGAMPTYTWLNTNYFRDVVFVPKQ